MRAGRPSFAMLLVGVLAVGWSGQALAATPPSQAPNGTAASPRATEQPGSAGFPTPEDAIRHYMAGVAQADVSKILEASAIGEMSTGFRFDLLADRLKAFVFPSSLAPADYPFYADMNRTLQSARVLSQVQMLAYSLLSSERMDGSVIAPVDKARADAFVQAVDPARLAGLTVADIRFSNARFEHDTRYLANAAAMASIYGADELTERLVLLSFDGKYYDIGFTLLRYGGDWKVSSQVANLAGTSALGTAQPTTIEGFDLMTSGD